MRAASDPVVVAALARLASRDLAPSPSLEEANRHLKLAVDVRVSAHRAREAKLIDVPEYLAQLRWVRAEEDRLEPIREAAGYRFSRAYELCTVRTDYLHPGWTPP